MLNILHIHTWFGGGGIEAMVCGLANEQSITENVTICSIFKPKDSDIFYHKFSPKVKKTSCNKLGEGLSLKILFKIFMIIRKGKYDVVHMHGSMYYYVLTILLSLFSKTKFFYTIHSDAFKESGRWDRKIHFLKKFFFKTKIVNPITISEASKRSFYNFYKCDSTLIYNGVPDPDIDDDTESILELYKITPYTKVFIHAGRITVAKNQLVLCKVFSSLITEGYDISLIIVGSKDEEDVFKNIEPYLCDRIIYIGQQDNIPRYFKECEAMCLPSIWEGMPVVLLEALSVGCITISSPVGGIPEVINSGLNGIISLSCSEEDYKKSIKDYLNMTPTSIQSMKENAKKTFSKFRIKNTAAQYLNCYRSKQKQSIQI